MSPIVAKTQQMLASSSTALASIKQEVIANAGHDTWVEKVRSVAIGALFVAIGLGIGYVGLTMTQAHDAIGPWLLGGGVLAVIIGSTIWDSELVGGAFKNVPGWIAGAIGAIYGAIARGKAGTP